MVYYNIEEFKDNYRKNFNRLLQENESLSEKEYLLKIRDYYEPFILFEDSQFKGKLEFECENERGDCSIISLKDYLSKIRGNISSFLLNLSDEEYKKQFFLAELVGFPDSWQLDLRYDKKFRTLKPKDKSLQDITTTLLNVFIKDSKLKVNGKLGVSLDIKKLDEFRSTINQIVLFLNNRHKKLLENTFDDIAIVDILQLPKEQPIQEELPQHINSAAAKPRLIILDKLGLLDYIKDHILKDSGNVTHLAEVVSAITGLSSHNIRKMLYSHVFTDSSHKNSPYKLPKGENKESNEDKADNEFEKLAKKIKPDLSPKFRRE